MRAALIILCACATRAAPPPFTPTPHGALVRAGNYYVELAVAGLSSFRVSVVNDGGAGAPPTQLPTLLVAPQAAFAPHNVSAAGAVVTLRAPFGALSIDAAAGTLALADAAGAPLAASAAPLATTGGGATVFAFALAPGAELLGSGADGASAQTLPRAGAVASVGNRVVWTPSFWCSDRWSMLAVSPLPPDNTSTYPVAYAAAGARVDVTVGGGARGAGNVDLYLSPARDLRAHVLVNARLSGAPAVPPRFAFGFLACRWGWASQEYTEGVLATFRNRSLPLDAFISDFEWFTTITDYELPPQGLANYSDFSFNNVTWPPPAAPLVAYYRDKYNARFGGIRKPRLGNSALLVEAQARGFLMGQGGDPARAPDGSRNTNFSIAAFRAWYAAQQAPLLVAGVALWWDDEGESGYTTYAEWTRAHQLTIDASAAPARRLLAINRAFIPGAQRLGAVVWTGDISPTWTDCSFDAHNAAAPAAQLPTLT